IDLLHAVGTLLNVGLDRAQLATCIDLCAAGVNPEALAAAVRELQREARAL
ncbi:hypothetical protein CXG81DRAFT_2627, partial [Caulochytrium protostelioides]